jgi:hypothetical protein
VIEVAVARGLTGLLSQGSIRMMAPFGVVISNAA